MKARKTKKIVWFSKEFKREEEFINRKIWMNL